MAGLVGLVMFPLVILASYVVARVIDQLVWVASGKRIRLM